MRFQRLHPHFLLCPKQKWHCRRGATLANIGNPKCRPPEPEVGKTGSGKPEVEIALERESVSDAIPTTNTTFSTMPTQQWHCRHGRHRPTIGNSNVGHGTESETGSGNSTRTKVLAMQIQRLHPTFSTMPTQKCTADTARHRRHLKHRNVRPRNRKWNPEVEINYERKELAMRFQRLSPYFRPCQTQICHCRHCPRSTDIRNSKCRRKPEVILTSGCPPMSDRVGQCR